MRFVKNKIILKNEVSTLRKKSDKTLPPTVVYDQLLDWIARVSLSTPWHGQGGGIPLQLSVLGAGHPLPQGGRGPGAWSYLTPLGSLVKLLIPLAMRVTMLTSWD